MQVEFYDFSPSPLLSIPRIMMDSNAELIDNTKKLDLLVARLLPDHASPPPAAGLLTPSLKLLRALVMALKSVDFDEITEFLSFKNSEN